MQEGNPCGNSLRPTKKTRGRNSEMAVMASQSVDLTEICLQTVA